MRRNNNKVCSPARSTLGSPVSSDRPGKTFSHPADINNVEAGGPSQANALLVSTSGSGGREEDPAGQEMLALQPIGRDLVANSLTLLPAFTRRVRTDGEISV